MADRGGLRVSRRGPALSALVVAAMGTAVVGLGYSLGEVSLNVDEVAGPAVFWVAAVFFLLAIPFRDATMMFAKSIRTALGAAAFVVYVAIHLLLYGFLFDVILASYYGIGALATTTGLFVTTNLFSPPSPVSVAFDLAYNPIIVLTAPPIFSGALSFYSISVALVIAVLVVANIGRTRELGRLRTATSRARAFVLLPAVGIVFGASCCLSVAGLISLATPAAAVLTSSPWIYYVTYFLFPCLAAGVLYLNLRSMGGTSGTSSPA
jgi:hypothetical protein